MTSWLVSSDVSVSPYALTSLIAGKARNQRCTNSFFSASPVTETNRRSGSSCECSSRYDRSGFIGFTSGKHLFLPRGERLPKRSYIDHYGRISQNGLRG